jgi:hypothetical protein
MLALRDLCVLLCQSGTRRGVALALALGLGGLGCGAAVGPSGGDATTADGVSPAQGCPSVDVLYRGTALGNACATEGAYCLDPSCDACRGPCPAVRCSRGVWTTAVDTALCLGDASASSDAAVTDAVSLQDGAVCIDVAPSDYDRSCQADGDCVLMTAGTFCANGPRCFCADATINARDQARYAARWADVQALLADSTGPVCHCPASGMPRCVAGQCTLCGGAFGISTCPDGG